ncbi:MAG TPA: prepilin-type N-terminal cleavage/methylation domain-containing protein [Thermodesulfobacteriota bacterium]|nr:prepilin-type N-terminal cleavage/methylation domain-containing protein [Thermodesulfobacteriota bacterium]
MRPQSRTTDKGFTLIEVLLAIFIGSIVLTVLYASFFQINRAKDRIEEELELYHEARIIMSKITKDLATAFPRGLVNSQSTGITTPFFYGVEEGDNSKLSFTSLSRTPTEDARESDQTEISYFLAPIEDSDLFALVRRDNPTFEPDTGGTQYAISERISGFSLTYLPKIPENGEAQGYSSEWNSNETLTLPAAVNVNIVLKSPRGEDIQFSTLVMIPIVN